MYDVIYFNVWSDIICTAAKLLQGTSSFQITSALTIASARVINAYCCHALPGKDSVPYAAEECDVKKCTRGGGE